MIRALGGTWPLLIFEQPILSFVPPIPGHLLGFFHQGIWLFFPIWNRSQLANSIVLTVGF